ncbi:hypothetical protein O159_04070 [Leifsonia xyli subsp. cynodontis DSM 46306]|jgi:hypothetical protein|uniref:Uncharacterized protein n=1 Tax=Leifsonia xyli subsp. cynodontis DSM 46306 TaxID=1389489 RepID=U3P4C9_LEIXC|nr:hypothetical protein [Leifsonia xyli]AGW40616.1 hypothetical protein O159_04070 [Leifsonia xyli subsp. cynodontis DSM 46306]
MITNTIERTAVRRGRTVLGSLTASVGIVALSLGLGAGIANAGTAGTFDQQHVDSVHVSLSPSSNKLILGTNREDSTVAPEDGYYLSSEVDATSALGTLAYDITVKKYTPSSGAPIWQIPKDQLTANARSVVWAGFASLGNVPSDPSTRYLQQHGTTAPNAARSMFYSPGGGLSTVSPSAKIRTTITLVSQPEGSTASIDWSGVPGVTASGTGAVSSPYMFAFALTTGTDEAFHRHTLSGTSTPPARTCSRSWPRWRGPPRSRRPTRSTTASSQPRSGLLHGAGARNRPDTRPAPLPVLTRTQRVCP